MNKQSQYKAKIDFKAMREAALTKMARRQGLGNVQLLARIKIVGEVR